MSQDHIIRLVSTKSKHVYWAHRKRTGGETYTPLTIKKFDPTLRKHVEYKEKRKSKK